MLRRRTTLGTCFFEQDAGTPLSRRCLAEAIGTALLMVAVSGSAMAIAAAAPAVPGNGSVASLIAGALGVAGVLVGLIFAFGAVSGGHFNPTITMLQWLSGERGTGCTITYVAAQLAGAVGGALVASLLYDKATASTPPGVSTALALSELVATAGLLVIVAGSARGGKATAGPFAVGGWIAGAIVATPSRCYANPAITLAAVVARGPAHLSLALAGTFVAAQLFAMVVARGVATTLFPVQQ